MLLLAGIAAGLLLGACWPLHGALPLAVQSAGFLLLAIGIAFDVSAIYTMWRARTNILPHRAADRLVTSGPFRFTRNPIYVGNTITLAAMALAFSNLWYAAAAAVMAALVDRLAIRREEAHLAARFGEAWRDYASRTPRWLL